MIQKIKIEIDVEKKAIQKIEMPDGINVLEAGKIFLALAQQSIDRIKLADDSKNKIIPVVNRIIGA